MNGRVLWLTEFGWEFGLIVRLAGVLVVGLVVVWWWFVPELFATGSFVLWPGVYVVLIVLRIGLFYGP